MRRTRFVHKIRYGVLARQGCPASADWREPMKLRLQEKIGYGFGDAASSMFWKLFSMYLMFFYTDIFGLAAAAVGTMFLITRIWDAAFDPFVGLLGDRTE